MTSPNYQQGPPPQGYGPPPNQPPSQGYFPGSQQPQPDWPSTQPPNRGYFAGPPPMGYQTGGYYQGPPQGYQQGYGQPQGPPPPQEQPAPVGVKGSLQGFYDQPAVGQGKSLSFENSNESYLIIVRRDLRDSDSEHSEKMVRKGEPRQLDYFKNGQPKFVLKVPVSLTPGQYPLYPEGEAVWYLRGAARDKATSVIRAAGAPHDWPEGGSAIWVACTGARKAGEFTQKTYDVRYWRPSEAEAIAAQYGIAYPDKSTLAFFGGTPQTEEQERAQAAPPAQAQPPAAPSNGQPQYQQPEAQPSNGYPGSPGQQSYMPQGQPQQPAPPAGPPNQGPPPQAPQGPAQPQPPAPPTYQPPSPPVASQPQPPAPGAPNQVTEEQRARMAQLTGAQPPA